MTTPTPTDATLPAQVYGHGWLDWNHTTRHLTEATCAWADFRGFHLASCPEQMPHTSHLWAWHHTDLWRLRLDSGRALVTQLTILPAAAQLHPNTVTVRRLPGLAWPPGYQMIGQQPVNVLDGDYQLYELPADPVNGSAAILFVGRT